MIIFESQPLSKYFVNPKPGVNNMMLARAECWAGLKLRVIPCARRSVLLQRSLMDDLNERDKKEYDRRSVAFMKQEKQMFREEMFERACRRFEMNRFRVADLTLKAMEWGSDSEMLLAFKELDIDRDGYIGGNELQKYLAHWGAFLDKPDIDKMIKFADKDGDGKVSFSEFSRMLRGEYDPPLGWIRRAKD